MDIMANSRNYEYLGPSNQPGLPKIHMGRIQYIYEQINRHYNTKLSSSEMGNKIGMTNSSFCRFFKKSTGKTFKEVLNETRIQNACFMLKETNMPIDSVAVECGFTSVPLFYKFFKKLIRQNPSVYRKKLSN